MTYISVVNFIEEFLRSALNYHPKNNKVSYRSHKKISKQLLKAQTAYILRYVFLTKYLRKVHIMGEGHKICKKYFTCF